jgi:DNA-directed RNA polymerase subunit RPC12/RpoP
MKCECQECQEEIRRLRRWIDDLQSGMYINCVYCGHRYGPNDEVPASMADVLKEHVEQCPEHPMSKLKEENAKLLARAKAAEDELWHRDRNYRRAQGIE